MSTNNKRLVGILLGAVIILLIPLVVMQFTEEVKWSLNDFIMAGILLFGTGLIAEFVLRKVKKVSYKIVIVIVLLIVFLLVWIDLAVGIFGTPFSGD